MSIQTLSFTSKATNELVRKELEKSFPSVRFEIVVDMPTPPYDLSLNVTTLIVRWHSGPSRDSVEEVVSAFQSLDWNPNTGVLEVVEHLEVTPEGALQQIDWGIDYVLCEGPAESSD